MGTGKKPIHNEINVAFFFKIKRKKLVTKHSNHSTKKGETKSSSFVNKKKTQKEYVFHGSCSRSEEEISPDDLCYHRKQAF